MKILIISSSPHKEKSKTLILAKEVLAGCAKNQDSESETIHLSDLKIDFCSHCEICHKKIMDCPIRDDVRMVFRKMLEADGIILATPNYINQVTGSMKTLFDRLAHFIHCKRLLGKYIVGVVTSGSGYDEPVLNYLKYYAHTCGAQYPGGISCRNFEVKEKSQEAIMLGRKLGADINKRKVYPDQLALIEEGRKHFAEVMKLRKTDWREEYEYWQDKGWL
jgi:multimeric flavodoxin WrbA